MIRRIMVLVTFFAVGLMAMAPLAAAKPQFKVAWSHYTGWEPWDYAAGSGILKKWADKYGIEIQLDLVNDYMQSINLYTGGSYDACVMTNMDALTIPAVGGVDSEAIIVGDYSNGNDGVVTRLGNTIKDLKGRTIKLVELSVSHYLLARAFALNGMSEKDVKLINTSDRDIGGLFISDTTPTNTIVTWNPILMQVRQEPGAKVLFDSAQIQGEILDMMVVRTNAPDSFKKALVGAWYETMAAMTAKDAKRTEAIAHMAKTAGGTVPEFERQLKTTKMFYTAKEAVEFTAGKAMHDTMEFVRAFCFDHGLYGQGAKSKDDVGISFPDGSIMGNLKNVKLRFTTTYMQMAADGKL